MERALAAPRDSDLFPFWASLALELLARSALAYVSPILLADTADPDGRNLLHALGFEPKVKAYVPRSIVANDVLTRCEQLVPEFTKDIENFCRGFTIKRNEELHSGGTPFSSLASTTWLPRFYESARVLLGFQGMELVDFVGSDEAKAAEVMLKAVADEAAKSVRKLIKAHSEVWNGKKQEEREQLEEAAKNHAHPWRGHVVSCPSCGSPALLTGEEVKRQPPVLENNELVVRRVVLPTELKCLACGLGIHSHSQLYAADLGGQFTSTLRFDPVHYYAVSDDDGDDDDESYEDCEYNNE